MKKKPAATPQKTGKLNSMSGPISVRIAEPLLEELDGLVRATGVQRSSHIQLAISEYLEKRRK